VRDRSPRRPDFADALGQAGLDQVARLVNERRAATDPDSWAAVGIKILRQPLATLSGDVDAHVAVLAENLHGACQYGEIVTVLRDAGRDADAERWARRSLARGSGDVAGAAAGPGRGARSRARHDRYRSPSLMAALSLCTTGFEGSRKVMGSPAWSCGRMASGARCRRGG
jgi:hypothetical protein